ncbi:hypothetical protein [Hymenobacter cavernae]|uniref:DUF4468 domain-containing protein n=1 Tax=Hymenobacter cavernae TaxID=2044852 RepID=A0ABQ1U974_9BACT|nr:hypothetical protein [Hymenobacter cavernae]GGF12196.1 hypothetical protein GCM10011383_24260 [Hymenobacter cavernae]
MHLKRFIISGLLVGLLTVSCTSNKSLEQESAQPSAEAIRREATAATKSAAAARINRLPTNRLAALDTAHFSPRFIRGLKESIQRESYAVRGKWLLLSPTDSIAFPADLPERQPITYTGTAQGRTYQLTVTRQNYSTIRYSAEVKQAGKSVARAAGTADLNPSFYTAAEVPVDTQTETAYGAYEFLANEPRQQNFAVLIGIGKDADKAEIYASELAAWRNAPTLRRK